MLIHRLCYYVFANFNYILKLQFCNNKGFETVFNVDQSCRANLLNKVSISSDTLISASLLIVNSLKQ